MAATKTVLIQHAGFPGGMLINESDYNPEHHTLVGAGETLADLSKADLIAMAEAKGIEVGNRDTKADLIAAIEAAG